MKRQTANKTETKNWDTTFAELRQTINLSIGRFRLQLSIDKQYVDHHCSNTIRVIELNLRITDRHHPRRSKWTKIKIKVTILLAV